MKVMSPAPAFPPIQSFDDFALESAPIITTPFQSKFGAVPWSQINAPGPQHKWLVKGLITDGELSMLAGASQSGKSFLTIDLAMAIARGVSWFGRKVERGGVIYEAGEGATGLRRKRIPAYMQEHGLTPDDDVPFVLLPQKINLWGGPEQAEALIDECRHWARHMSAPLRLIIIDTLSKAMTGADEISGKDVGVVIERCDQVRRATGAAVLLVHHMNAGGEKVRGHTSILANLDSVLICRPAVTPGSRGVPEEQIKDDEGRKVRELLIGKAKDGESDMTPDRFVLRQVVLGRDADNEPVTSCVVAPPAGEELTTEDAGKGQRKPMGPNLTVAFRALCEALSRHGRTPPATVRAPNGVQAVTLSQWRDEYQRVVATEDEDADKLRERVKKARDRAVVELTNRNFIRKDGDWVWRTNRRAPGIDPEPAPAPAPPTDQGPSPVDEMFPW